MIYIIWYNMIWLCFRCRIYPTVDDKFSPLYFHFITLFLSFKWIQLFVLHLLFLRLSSELLFFLLYYFFFLLFFLLFFFSFPTLSSILISLPSTSFSSLFIGNTVLTRSGSLLITILTFLVYSYIPSNGPLTADRAFAALAVINILGRYDF